MTTHEPSSDIVCPMPQPYIIQMRICPTQYNTIEDEMMATITGKIVFPDNTPHFTGAQVAVRVMDTGMMDAPAAHISEQLMTDVAYTGQPLSFSIEADLTSTGRPTISAHVSLDGTGDLAKGDYITKSAYAATEGQAVTLSVERV